MNEERLALERTSKQPHPAAGRLFQICALLAAAGGLAAVPSFGVERALDLLPGFFVLLILPGIAIIEALGLSKHREQPPLEVRADLTGFEVGGHRFALGELKWQRRSGGLWIADRSTQVVVGDLRDRSQLERFLARHVERAKLRHGDGEDEIPAALKQARKNARQNTER